MLTTAGLTFSTAMTIGVRRIGSTAACPVIGSAATRATSVQRDRRDMLQSGAARAAASQVTESTMSKRLTIGDRRGKNPRAAVAALHKVAKMSRQNPSRKEERAYDHARM